MWSGAVAPAYNKRASRVVGAPCPPVMNTSLVINSAVTAGVSWFEEGGGRRQDAAM